MFRIFYAESDATLYEGVSDMNTGLDEVFEVGKRLDTFGDTYQYVRSLLKFDMDEIQTVLTKYSVELSDCKFMLQLHTSHAKSLPATYTIDAKIAYDDWINGTGFGASVPYKTDGVTWEYPQSGSNWTPSGSINDTLLITGSGLGGSWLLQSSSGMYDITRYDQSFYAIDGLDQSDSFSYRTTDVLMDVTGAVNLWINGSAGNTITNNGFLLKFSEADETNNNQYGFIRFYSKETHTIYVPKLVMYWDNSVDTGTLDTIDEESYTVRPALKKRYKDTEISKIRFKGRDKYPMRDPSNLYPYDTVKRLPSTTYYSIVDAHTDETIIPFDDIYTKVSCDATSNFIHLDMNGLMPERYYRIALKIVNGFTEDYIDNEYYFKVER